MTAALRRQWRRAAWLARDVGRSGRAVAHALALARRPAPDVALGVLEGAPWAVRGRENAYLLRLVNDGTAARRLRLAVGGTAPGAPPLATAATFDVPARSAREVHLVTDWVARFALADARPLTDPAAFLTVPPGVPTSCRVDARLADAASPGGRLTIVQPLVA